LLKVLLRLTLDLLTLFAKRYGRTTFQGAARVSAIAELSLMLRYASGQTDRHNTIQYGFVWLASYVTRWIEDCRI